MTVSETPSVKCLDETNVEEKRLDHSGVLTSKRHLRSILLMQFAGSPPHCISPQTQPAQHAQAVVLVPERRQKHVVNVAGVDRLTTTRDSFRFHRRVRVAAEAVLSSSIRVRHVVAPE
jgi:hypothetical protein